MRRIAEVVKRLLIPGTMTFLIAGLAIGVVLINSGPPAIRYARMWLSGLFGLYWLLSLPVTANVLISSLHSEYDTIRTAAEAAGAKVLVVIGNGSVHYAAGAFRSDQLTRRSTFCVFEAARLYQLIQPDWVVASGGMAGTEAHARPESELIRDLLVRCGVPIERMLLESTSRTTAQQISSVTRVLQQRGLGGPVVVVTTGAHMPRVMKLFAGGTVDVIPSVTPELSYDEGRTGWRRWLPSAAALRGSESALYEYLAHAYLAMTHE